MSQANNALMTKVRTMYGKRLTNDDYENLIAAGSIPKIATYLKTETVYQDVLGEVQEELIHRGQLEQLLHKRVLTVCLKLLRYSFDQKLFLKVYIMQNELQELLTVIRLLNAGEMDRYIVSFPAYMKKFLTIDLDQFTQIKNYNQFLKALEHTQYLPILQSFRPSPPDNRVNMAQCEHALLMHYYQVILEDVNQHYHGPVKEQLLQLFYWQIDTHNFSVVLRLKHYYNYPPEEIDKLVLKIPTKLSKKAKDELLYAKNSADFISVFQKHNRQFRQYTNQIVLSPETISAQVKQAEIRTSQKQFRFSTKPVVSSLHYLNLLEMEVTNIIHIIEGTHYKMPKEELRKLLII